MSRLLRFKTGTDEQTFTNHDLENDLARSIEAADPTTWTVKLRSGARFQSIAPVNGHPVEAEDVKATFTRALNEPRNPNRGALGMIDPNRIETPSADTVVFKLNEPYAPFQEILASPAYSRIFPREILAGSYDSTKQLIGSGPFMLDSFTPDVQYILKKNPAWFEPGRPYIDEIQVAIIPALAQQLAQFTAHNLDEASPGINDLDAIQHDNPLAKLITGPPNDPGPIYFQLGDSSSPFQDVRIRRAISMAIDRDAIGAAVYGGHYQATVFVPKTLGKWSLGVDEVDANTGQYYKYNLAEAKKLLDAAGASSLQIKFAYVVNGGFSNSLQYRSHAQAAGNMLQALGIKVTLVQQDFQREFLDAGKGSRQGYYDKDTMLFGSLQQFNSVDEFIFSYFHSKSTQNQEHLNDSSLDAMIDKARATVNTDERLKAYKDIQKYIADRMYLTSTCGGYTFLLVQPRVQNYNPGSLGSPGSANELCAETYAKLWLKT